ncbi:hypothetical protein [Streptomyces sp. NPDC088762]|uniref:hypothetical protein n=1 Tax=Streptomyces sp. NPDC088762 TaxID=3365891 RepID=UPI00381B9E6D
MKSNTEAAMSLAAENPSLAALLGAVVLAVGLPFTLWQAGLVRGFWSPKIKVARRKVGRVCQRVGDRLSGTN